MTEREKALRDVIRTLEKEERRARREFRKNDCCESMHIADVLPLAIRMVRGMLEKA